MSPADHERIEKTLSRHEGRKRARGAVNDKRANEDGHIKQALLKGSRYGPLFGLRVGNDAIQ